MKAVGRAEEAVYDKPLPCHLQSEGKDREKNGKVYEIFLTFVFEY